MEPDINTTVRVAPAAPLAFAVSVGGGGPVRRLNLTAV